MDRITEKRSTRERMRLTHHYYRRTGLYMFAVKNVLKVVGILAVIAIIFIILDKYVFDVNAVFTHLTETLQPFYVLLVFFISESLFGLIPPDIFIAWSSTFESSVWMLSLLALISYVGGIVSYFLGKWARLVPRINKYLERKYAKYMKQINRWGGIVVVFAALFPLPYSTISIVAGMMKYPFKPYLLYGLTRFLRFYIYALAIFKVM